MPSQSFAEDTLDWFIRGFTARDLAEPLLSVDEGSGVAEARELVASRGASVLGIRRNGLAARWITAADVATAADLRGGTEFANAQVVAETTPLSDVICLLNAEERLFVLRSQE